MSHKDDCEYCAKLLTIGSPTKYGKVAAIHSIKGERYYFFLDDAKTVVTYMPASEVEGG